jgi:hypothetical protein
MRSLALLGLIALSTLPLSAHDHGWHRGWRGRYVESYPRMSPRIWVASEGRWIDRDRCGADRWDDRPVRWERRYDREDCDEGVVVRPLPRPLPPPGRVQVELHFGW